MSPTNFLAVSHNKVFFAIVQYLLQLHSYLIKNRRSSFLSSQYFWLNITRLIYISHIFCTGRMTAMTPLTRVVNLWAQISGRSCSILFPSVFLKDFSMKIWTLLITYLKLSIVLSKKWRILEKSSRNLRKKRPGPARRNLGPERPGQVHTNLRAGTARPGPICQAWD